MSIILKSAAAAVAAIGFGGAAIAGPYANIETNAGWAGNDYTGAVTDFHVGYEGDLSDSTSYYVQGGPALVAIDGVESETEFSGISGDGDASYGSKLGLKYSF